MRYMFAGSEQKGWRELLYSNGVRDMSLSFVGLLRRTRHPERFALRDAFPEDVRLFVDSGSFSLNKDDSKYTDDDIRRIADQYYAFVVANLDRLEMASSFDARKLSAEFSRAWNDRLQLELGDKFLPIWTPGDFELHQFSGPRLGIQAGGSVTSYTAQLNRLVIDKGVKLHGVGMTQMDVMRDVRWDTVGSTAWLSTAQYGDTILWSGTELMRFPKNYKGRGRDGHRSWITDNGFNWELIREDNVTELLRLSIWSWQKYVDHLNRMEQFTGKRVTQVADTPDNENGELPDRAVARVERGTGHRKLLPVLGVQYDDRTELDEDGEEVTVRVPRIRAATQSLMQCSTCIVQDRCPEFTPGADCAFDIPLDLSLPRAEDELWTTMTEIQGQRVLMMRMIEQVGGNGHDPNLGPEIDRLMRILNAKKKQGQTTVRQVTEVTLPGGPGGFMSELLGGKAAQRLRPQIEQGENVVDAEVVEGQDHE